MNMKSQLNITVDSAPRESEKPGYTMHVLQHMSPGGIENFALELTTSSLYNRYCITSLEGKKESALQSWPRLERIADRLSFMGKKPGLKLSLIFKLATHFRTHNVETVHTHHIGPLIYGGIAARIAGINSIIHTEHDAWHLDSFKRRIVQRLMLMLVRPKLVADADQVAQNMKKYLGDVSVKVIRNGIDTERFVPGDFFQARKKYLLPSNKIIIGSAGRLEHVKGHDLLIDALKYMPESIHLAIAGDGSQKKQLLDKTRLLGIEDRVHFLGLLDDMPSFYQSLDLFCLPSRNEGYPLSSLEAQSCGVRAAVTDVGGAKESICPGSGVVLTSHIPKDIAKVLMTSLYETARISPRAFVRANGDLNSVCKAYQALNEERNYD